MIEDVNAFITTVALTAAKFYKHELNVEQKKDFDRAYCDDVYEAFFASICKHRLDVVGIPSGVNMIAEPYNYFDRNDLKKYGISSTKDLLKQIANKYKCYIMQV